MRNKIVDAAEAVAIIRASSRPESLGNYRWCLQQRREMAAIAA